MMNKKLFFFLMLLGGVPLRVLAGLGGETSKVQDEPKKSISREFGDKLLKAKDETMKKLEEKRDTAKQKAFASIDEGTEKFVNEGVESVVSEAGRAVKKGLTSLRNLMRSSSGQLKKIQENLETIRQEDDVSKKEKKVQNFCKASGILRGNNGKIADVLTKSQIGEILVLCNAEPGFVASSFAKRIEARLQKDPEIRNFAETQKHMAH